MIILIFLAQLLASPSISASPNVGQAPLKVSILARPAASGYYCIEAEGEEGGWQRTCRLLEERSWETWMVLEEDRWTMRLRRRTDGPTVATTTVIVTMANPGKDGL